ncbi:MAG TPA: PAS domain S-box protein, partial [Holophaga sp.]|nr:PAS domain S-box protein [Holophaga sp.]
ILAREAIVSDFITRLRDKKGTEHLISWDSRAMTGPDGTPAGSLAIGRDVTERRKAEAALQESERKLAGLIANLPGFAYQTVNEPGWPMRYISPGCRQVTGYGPEAFQGDHSIPFTSLIPPAFRERMRATWMQVLGTGGIFEDEYPIVTASGEERWLWERGSGVYDDQHRVIAVEGFITDITKRKRAEESLRKTSVALDQSPVIIVITDRAGTIEYVNAAFTRHTGYEVEEVLGRNPRILKSGEHSPEFYRELWDTLLDGRTWQGRFCNRRKDGSLYWESATISPLRDGSGLVTHFVAAKENITGAIRAEEERRSLERQLAQAQKLESLGSLAGGVAHDINNVLSAILALATIEGEDAPPGSSLKTSMDTIAKACLRGGALVKGLLGFAQEGLAEERPLDLNTLVREEVAILERTTLQKVRLAVDLAEDLAFVKGDASALSHALMNLCVNAVDAMPDGGDLVLRTRNEGASVVLEVVDTGCGMPPEVQERAMDPFFTTKPQGKGTGLGLSIVYGAVKAHHGELRIQSQPGRGTTVALRLPACDRPPEAPRAPGHAPAPARSLEVLLVDDDELIQSSTGKILKLLGHVPTVVGSGEEALQRLQEGLDPDVVLLDLNMPGMGGAEALVRIRELKPELPVLLATGRADQQAMDLVRSVPRVTLLPKPYMMKDLRALLAVGIP